VSLNKRDRVTRGAPRPEMKERQENQRRAVLFVSDGFGGELRPISPGTSAKGGSQKEISLKKTFEGKEARRSRLRGL